MKSIHPRRLLEELEGEFDLALERAMLVDGLTHRHRGTLTQTMSQSQDALEVAEVLGNKLRPVYTFAAISVALAGAGVSYVWSLSDFIHRDAAHEKQQDDNYIVMQRRLNEHDAGIKTSHELQLDIIQILLTDFDLIRDSHLRMLKPKQRESMRRNFEAQRLKSIALLAKAGK